MTDFLSKGDLGGSHWVFLTELSEANLSAGSVLVRLPEAVGLGALRSFNPSTISDQEKETKQYSRASAGNTVLDCEDESNSSIMQCRLCVSFFIKLSWEWSLAFLLFKLLLPP